VRFSEDSELLAYSPRLKPASGTGSSVFHVAARESPSFALRDLVPVATRRSRFRPVKGQIVKREIGRIRSGDTSSPCADKQDIVPGPREVATVLKNAFEGAPGAGGLGKNTITASWPRH